jgi:hypothetical protein
MTSYVETFDEHDMRQGCCVVSVLRLSACRCLKTSQRLRSLRLRFYRRFLSVNTDTYYH